MDERKINIFLTNLDEYNQGRLVGEWLELPCSRDSLAAAFQRIGIRGGNRMCFITDCETPFADMRNGMGEIENIEELNFLAVRMMEMDEGEWNTFSEVICSAMDDCHSAAEYINLTYNLDKFSVLPAKDETELGIYLCRKLNPLPDIFESVNLSAYIDYEEIGRDAAINYGRFGKNGFVEKTNYMEPLYNGTIPEKYRITEGFSGKETFQPARAQAYDDMEMER